MSFAPSSNTASFSLGSSSTTIQSTFDIPSETHGGPSQKLGGILESLNSQRRLWCCFYTFMAYLGLAATICSFEVFSLQRLPAEVLLFCSLGCTVALVFGLFKYHIADTHFLVQCGEIMAAGTLREQMSASGVLSVLCCDVAVALFQPLPLLGLRRVEIPFGHARYNLDGLLLMAMLLRIRYIPRLFIELSSFRAETSRVFALLNHVKIDRFFILKVLIHYDITFVLLWGSTFVLETAYFLLLSERPDPAASIHVYSDSVWSVLVTMSTVGYGDFYPVTWLGRGISLLAAGVAIGLVAVIVTLVFKSLELSPMESKVVALMGTVRQRAELKQKAAVCIQTSWRLYRNHSVSSVRNGRDAKYSSQEMMDFHNLRRDATSPSADLELAIVETQANVQAAQAKLDTLFTMVSDIHARVMAKEKKQS